MRGRQRLPTGFRALTGLPKDQRRSRSRRTALQLRLKSLDGTKECRYKSIAAGCYRSPVFVSQTPVSEHLVSPATGQLCLHRVASIIIGLPKRTGQGSSVVAVAMQDCTSWRRFGQVGVLSFCSNLLKDKSIARREGLHSPPSPPHLRPRHRETGEPRFIHQGRPRTYGQQGTLPER